MSDEAGRIEALETRIAWQEQAIEDLNATLVEQARIIEALSRRLARLEAEMAEAEFAAREGGPERAPPHY